MNVVPLRVVFARLMLGAGIIFGLVSAGCGAGDARPAAGASGAPAAAIAPASVTITEAWAAASGAGMDVSAVLTNGTGQSVRIVGATVPATVAKRAELYLTSQENGATKMARVDTLDVPASGSLRLDRSAAHIRLQDLARPLQAGEAFTVTLQLQGGGTVGAQVEVRASAGALSNSSPNAAATPEATRSASYTDSCG